MLSLQNQNKAVDDSRGDGFDDANVPWRTRRSGWHVSSCSMKVKFDMIRFVPLWLYFQKQLFEFNDHSFNFRPKRWVISIATIWIFHARLFKQATTVPKNKHIFGIRELMLKTLPLPNICYSFASCLLIFEKMVSHRISIRIHTILQALNTLLGLQFTAWAFLLKGRDNFLSKSHREVADLTKVKFGPFEGRSRKSELSQRLAGFVYDITITRQKFLSEAPKHDSDFYFAWYSAGNR